MRRSHFDSLRPVCPACQAAGRGLHPLQLADAAGERAGQIAVGILHCPGEACRREFPIIDGVPLLHPELRAFVAANVGQLTARDDLTPEIDTLIGDCCGPQSAYEVTRQQLSGYGWDHWADLDPGEPPAGPDSQIPDSPMPGSPAPGSAVRLLEACLELAGLPAGPVGSSASGPASGLPDGPLLDLGCAAGRTAFRLAALTGRQVIGADLNFAMLRLAAGALLRGRVRYPRRRIGLVYDRREFAVAEAGAEQTDFWLCDAAALPFRAGSFAAVAGLNLLDSVASPVDLVESLHAVLPPGGLALLTTPWDWSPGATPVEAWLGGHSQRGDGGGAAAPRLRQLLESAGGSGFEIVAERDAMSWRVRLHERGSVDYEVYAVVARRRADPGKATA